MNDGIIISAILGFAGMIITAMIRLVPSRSKTGEDEQKAFTQIVQVLTNMNSQLTQLMAITQEQQKKLSEVGGEVHELHKGFAPEGRQAVILTMQEINRKLDELLEK